MGGSEDSEMERGNTTDGGKEQRMKGLWSTQSHQYLGAKEVPEKLDVLQK